MAGHGEWVSPERPQVPLHLGTGHVGGGRDEMGQKSRARDLSAGFLCLPSPFSYCLKFAKSWWEGLSLRGSGVIQLRPQETSIHSDPEHGEVQGGWASVKMSKNFCPYRKSTRLDPRYLLRFDVFQRLWNSNYEILKCSLK